MNIVAITQARYSSSRLPGKILMEALPGKTFLDIHLERINKSKRINHFVVATTNEPDSYRITDIAKRNGFDFFQGNLLDVLDRFYQAAKPYHPDIVVRLTSDCPLIDATLIDQCIEKLISEDLDYATNTITEHTYPNGVDVEVMKFSALEKAINNATDNFSREHVTPYIWQNSTLFQNTLFKAGLVKSEQDYSNFRITLDYIEDANLLSKIISILSTEAAWIDYIKLIASNQEIFEINKGKNNI